MGEVLAAGFSDRGSIPLISIETEQVKLCIWILSYTGICFVWYIEEKVTALYVMKVAYNAVIFMI